MILFSDGESFVFVFVFVFVCVSFRIWRHHRSDGGVVTFHQRGKLDIGATQAINSGPGSIVKMGLGDPFCSL